MMDDTLLTFVELVKTEDDFQSLCNTIFTKQTRIGNDYGIIICKFFDEEAKDDEDKDIEALDDGQTEEKVYSVSELVEMLREIPQVTLIEVAKEGLPMKELLERIQGRYVTFLQPKMLYQNQAIVDAAHHLKKENVDVKVLMATRARSINKVFKEHNAHVRAICDGTENSYPYHYLDIMYFTYIFDKSKLPVDLELSYSYPEFDIIRMSFQIFSMKPECSYERDVRVKVARNSDITCGNMRVLSDEEFIGEYIKRVIEPMAEFIAGGKASDLDYAYYNFVFHVYRLALELKADNELNEMLYKKTDDVLKGLANADILIFNQYVSRVAKQYLLNRYFPDLKENDRENYDRVFLTEFSRVMFYFIKFEEDSINLQFSISLSNISDKIIKLRIDKKGYECRHILDKTIYYWFGQEIARERIFEVNADIPDGDADIDLRALHMGEIRKFQFLSYNKYTPFTNKVFLYVKKKGRLIYLNKERNTILLRKRTATRELGLRIKRSFSFIKRGRIGIKSLIARKIYEINKKKKKNQRIWLVSDRTNRADDNGEVMFDYLCKNAQAPIHPIFVIDDGIEDCERMKKLGDVIHPFTKKHKMDFLLSEYLISSQANKAVINPFGKLQYYYKDLMYDKKLVFLQHGVIKEDLSGWLNRYNRNLFGFIVTTVPEYNSILEYNYHYTPAQVWLTGLPRFDRLYHDEKKYITIMPTWRKYLCKGVDAEGVWQLSDDFTESDYFKFFNSLLNSEKLINRADELGYKLCFMPHPTLIGGLELFDRNEKVQFFDASKSYREVYAQSNLIVTDYSSAIFDFIYIKKPIIYAQFDKETFFAGEHSYVEGYFDYERDGFGEIETDLEGTVNRIIEYMENDCKLKDEYLERIENTFAYDDRNCCERVYERIINDGAEPTQ